MWREERGGRGAIFGLSEERERETKRVEVPTEKCKKGGKAKNLKSRPAEKRKTRRKVSTFFFFAKTEVAASFFFLFFFLEREGGGVTLAFRIRAVTGRGLEESSTFFSVSELVEISFKCLRRRKGKKLLQVSPELPDEKIEKGNNHEQTGRQGGGRAFSLPLPVLLSPNALL